MNTKKNIEGRLEEESSGYNTNLPENKPFPRKLRTLMDEENVTQETLGQYLGVTRQTISLYITGKTIPDIYKAKAIADYFGVSVGYLLDDTQAHIAFYNNEQFKDYCKMYGGETYCKICTELSELTDEAQKKVLDRIEELKEIPRYNLSYQEYLANSYKDN